MEIRHGIHPEHGKHLDTDGLRKEFLVQDLFRVGEVKLVYSHIDRIIVGGVCPSRPLTLEVPKEIIGGDSLLERREMGIINVGGDGRVTADGTRYDLAFKECLYLGRGTKDIRFESIDASKPAKFYLLSGPAHKEYPSVKAGLAEANRIDLGSDEQCNKRTIYQYIHQKGIQSANLVMGFTSLAPGSVWNTMPCHTHQRRMEVYFYFEVQPDAAVFHLMGEPTETRHIVMRSEEAVISPSWSIHSGVGTKNYSFIWGMVGENQTFDDMDGASIDELR